MASLTKISETALSVFQGTTVDNIDFQSESAVELGDFYYVGFMTNDGGFSTGYHVIELDPNNSFTPNQRRGGLFGGATLKVKLFVVGGQLYEITAFQSGPTGHVKVNRYVTPFPVTPGTVGGYASTTIATINPVGSQAYKDMTFAQLYGNTLYFIVKEGQQSGVQTFSTKLYSFSGSTITLIKDFGPNKIYHHFYKIGSDFWAIGEGTFASSNDSGANWQQFLLFGPNEHGTFSDSNGINLWSSIVNGVSTRMIQGAPTYNFGGVILSQIKDGANDVKIEKVLIDGALVFLLSSERSDGNQIVRIYAYDTGANTIVDTFQFAINEKVSFFETKEANRYLIGASNAVTDTVIVYEFGLSCDLVLVSVDKTNETAPAANDGTITVNATSSFPIEYQLDAGPWQPGNTFSSLAPGTYTVTIRDSNPASCGTLTSSDITIYAANVPDPVDCVSNDPKIYFTPLNNNNFINWFSAVGVCSDFTDLSAAECIPDPTVFANPYRKAFRDPNIQTYPVISSGEITSFYMNMDTPFDVGSFPGDIFANWRLAIVNDHGIVSDNISALFQDFLPNGTDFNVWSEVTMPGIPNGIYRLMIYDSVSGSVIYLSSRLECINLTPECDSVRLVYRASVNMYNYQYDNLPGYSNQIRIKMYDLGSQAEGEIDNYRESSTGILRKEFTDLDEFFPFETYHFNDLQHDAMKILPAHDGIGINGKDMVAKGMYSIDYNVRRKRNKGSIEFYDQKFSSTNKYGKVIEVLGSETGLLLGDDGCIKL